MRIWHMVTRGYRVQKALKVSAPASAGYGHVTASYKTRKRDASFSLDNHHPLTTSSQVPAECAICWPGNGTGVGVRTLTSVSCCGREGWVSQTCCMDHTGNGGGPLADIGNWGILCCTAHTGNGGGPLASTLRTGGFFCCMAHTGNGGGPLARIPLHRHSFH